MKKILTLTTLVSLLVALSGCSVFDPEARDKDACDELSMILSSSEGSSLPAEATSGFIKALEDRVLPKASAQLGGTIHELIDSYKSIGKDSIFDQLGGTFDTLALGALVLDRCLAVSSKAF